MFVINFPTLTSWDTLTCGLDRRCREARQSLKPARASWTSKDNLNDGHYWRNQLNLPTSQVIVKPSKIKHFLRQLKTLHFGSTNLVLEGQGSSSTVQGLKPAWTLYYCLGMFGKFLTIFYHCETMWKTQLFGKQFQHPKTVFQKHPSKAFISTCKVCFAVEHPRNLVDRTGDPVA